VIKKDKPLKNLRQKVLKTHYSRELGNNNQVLQENRYKGKAMASHSQEECEKTKMI
jgi:hypothetical protein